MRKGVEITGTLPSRATEKGAMARCGFANPLIPAVQAARQEREISNAIVLGFVLRTDRSYDLRFYSRVAFLGVCGDEGVVERESFIWKRSGEGWGRQEPDASAAALEKGC